MLHDMSAGDTSRSALAGAPGAALGDFMARHPLLAEGSELREQMDRRAESATGTGSFSEKLSVVQEILALLNRPWSAGERAEEHKTATQDARQVLALMAKSAYIGAAADQLQLLRKLEGQPLAAPANSRRKRLVMRAAVAEASEKHRAAAGEVRARTQQMYARLLADPETVGAELRSAGFQARDVQGLVREGERRFACGDFENGVGM